MCTRVHRRKFRSSATFFFKIVLGKFVWAQKNFLNATQSQQRKFQFGATAAYVCFWTSSASASTANIVCTAYDDLMSEFADRIAPTTVERITVSFTACLTQRFLLFFIFRFHQKQQHTLFAAVPMHSFNELPPLCGHALSEEMTPPLASDVDVLINRRRAVVAFLEENKMSDNICHTSVDVLRHIFRALSTPALLEAISVEKIEAESRVRGMRGEIDINDSNLTTPQTLYKSLTKNEPSFGHGVWEVHLGIAYLEDISEQMDPLAVQFHHSLLIDRQGEHFVVYQSCAGAYKLLDALKASEEGKSCAEFGMSGVLQSSKEMLEFCRALQNMGFGGATHTKRFMDKFFGQQCRFSNTMFQQNVVFARRLNF